MECKLCLQNKILLKKSHIIPDFMHRGLFDQSHALHRIDLKDFKKSKRLYDGEYESNILCAKCDNNLIGQYENYASIILYGGKLPKSENNNFQNKRNIHGVELTHCKGIDYGKFKLFLLSILWRSSISKREFFKNVSLGPYENKIRQMIFDGDPGEPLDFPCFISTYKNIKDLPDGFIGQSKKYRTENILGYTFVIGGFVYIFLVSKIKKPDWLSDVAINKNNEISIPHMNRENAKKLINHFMQVKFVI